MVGGAVTACVVAIIALVAVVHSVSHQYDAILTGTVQAGQDARTMQVAFKKQVQEWKDILLRGSNQADLDKYSQQFRDEEQTVASLAAKLAGEVTDPVIKSEIQQFRDQHVALSASYHDAYDGFVASKGADFKTADTAVKGQDRAPTDLIDKIVSDLHAQQVRLADDQKGQVGEVEVIVVVVGVLLVGTMLAGLYFASRGIVRPVHRATSVLGEVATGNLTVSMGGTYDGEFEAIKQSINTAIEDLNVGLGRVVAGADRIAETSRFVDAVGDQLIQSAQVTRGSLDVIERAVRSIDTGGGSTSLVRQIAEVRGALGTMSAITERNLRAAEDARRATDELRTNSDNLQRVVAAYKLKPIGAPVGAIAARGPLAAVGSAEVGSAEVGSAERQEIGAR
jgi:methyl-accepting chemotaxis protein